MTLFSLVWKWGCFEEYRADMLHPLTSKFSRDSKTSYLKPFNKDIGHLQSLVTYFFFTRHLDLNMVLKLKNERPTWCHLLYYFTSYVLNMLPALIYPSSGACDCGVELPHRSSCSQSVVCWRFGAAGFEWCSFCSLKHNSSSPCLVLSVQGLTKWRFDSFKNVRRGTTFYY